MRNKYLWGFLLAIIFALVPLVTVASPSPKVFSGTIIQIIGTQLNFKLGSGAVYGVQTPYVTLERRYGQAMLFSEFLVGDKIEVQGVARPDNSIAASSIRDISLYAHTATFSAKVVDKNIWSSSFTMASKTYGTQTVYVSSLTSFKINNAAGSLAGLLPGMSVTVKGVWDRDRSNLQAQTVDATLRLIDIYFTGRLMVRSDTAFTVVSPDNVMYAVDVGSATFQSKNNKSMTPLECNMDDVLHVWGKHASGSNQVTATKVKDTMVSK